MKRRSWIVVIVSLLVALAQMAAEGGLNATGGKVNFVLAALVLMINFAEYPFVLAFAIICGTILDIYSGLPFGIMLLPLFLTSVALEALFVNFFTNYSFYSLLLLGALAVLGYNAFFVALSAAAYYAGWSDALPGWAYAYRVAWQMITTGLLLAGAYYCGSYLSRRFKPMFLR